MNDAIPSDIIYLDHQATTPVDPRVIEAMLPFFGERFGNPASRQHAIGRRARDAVGAARVQIAALIAADARSLIFTSGATESNNLALIGLARFHAAQPNTRGKHIVANTIEHKAVLDVCAALDREGFEVTYVKPTPKGIITADAIAEAMREGTFLVTTMWANNEIGTINEIEAIGRLCKGRGVYFHCDATQAVGKIPVDVEAAGVDLMSLSAHKMYGPMGIGALYLRRREPRVRLEPIIHGGGHERGYRSGTLNLPAIVGFGKACELCGDGLDENAGRLASLRDRLESRLTQRINGARINGDVDHRLPHATNLSLPGVEADQLMCELPDVAISSGSACTTDALEASHVLRQLGFDDARVRSSVRMSVGRFTTVDQVDRAAERIARAALAFRGRVDANVCEAD